MKVYLSGPITGVPDWKERFGKVYGRLSALGQSVCTPVYIGEAVERRVHEPGWKDYMKADIRVLMECDAIMLLPGWEESKGARLERHIAHELGIIELVWPEPLD